LAQAIADPAQMRSYASRLQQEVNQLNETVARLNAAHRQLGDTWQDQEYRSYVNEFEQTMKQLRRFIDEANKNIPVINRKAAHLEEYLQTK
jgi:uncharacterized protein YukE